MSLCLLTNLDAGGCGTIVLPAPTLISVIPSPSTSIPIPGRGPWNPPFDPTNPDPMTGTPYAG